MGISGGRWTGGWSPDRDDDLRRWDITCAAADAKALYATISGKGAVPAGPLAQTSMRIEKGFCALGHKRDRAITLVAAGPDLATCKEGGLIGADWLEAARETGNAARMFSLVLDNHIAVPLGREPIFLDARIVGQTSTCASGFRIGRPVALGHAYQASCPMARVQIDIARQMFDATAVEGPGAVPARTRTAT